MQAFIERTVEFVRSEDGPTTTEYSVMLALIIMVCLASITTLSTKVSGIFANMDARIPSGAGS